MLTNDDNNGCLAIEVRRFVDSNRWVLDTPITPTIVDVERLAKRQEATISVFFPLNKILIEVEQAIKSRVRAQARVRLLKMYPVVKYKK